MIKITTWRPDTCECEIEYSWDDSLDENTRVHTAHKINKACSVHQTVADKVLHYGIVLEENQRKNKLYGAILENIPAVVQDVLQPDGSITKQLKAGLDYKWSFDANRIMEIDLVGFTVVPKTAIQNLANILFPNKVKIL